VSDCVICRARPPRRTSADSRRGCDVCIDELAGHLDDLTERIPLLRLMLIPGGQPSSVRLARDASPAPLRVDVLALLDDRGDLAVEAVLARHAAVLAGERRLSGKAPAIQSLRAHLGWVAEADWLEEFAKDLRRLAIEVRRVVGEAPQAVATCRRELDSGRECGGSITASPYSDTATCSRCGDEWPRERWQLLGRLQEAP
jgi:hypothetical protein